MRNNAAQSQQPDPPEDQAPFSDDEGFEQPLGQPEIIPPSPDAKSASAVGTAAVLTKVVDFGCSFRFGIPLDALEAESLTHDFAAVLVKYDVPDLPYAEEFTLVANLGGIVFKRAAAQEQARQAEAQKQKEQRAAAPPPPPRTDSDSPIDREKRSRQNGFDKETGIPMHSAEARDFLP